MFSFRWNRYYDINWTANYVLLEFIAFNKQVIKFDNIIRVKADCCPIYINCVIKVLQEFRGCRQIAALLNKKEESDYVILTCSFYLL